MPVMLRAALGWLGLGCAPAEVSESTPRLALRASTTGVVAWLEEDLALAADGLPADAVARRAWRAAGVVAVSPAVRPSSGRRDPVRFAELGLDRAVRVQLRPGLGVEAARNLVGLIGAEADPVGHGAATPDDPGFVLQWPLDGLGRVDGAVPGVSVRALEAWDVATGDGSTVIAILDTGANLTEPDLVHRLWRNEAEVEANGIDDDANGYVDDVLGWDFVNDDADPDDDNGHGSAVAGLAAAHGDNGIGFAGVCWDCRVMALKDLDVEAFGYVSDWAEALVYAADHGATVANLSSVSALPSTLLDDAVAYAVGVGTSVVASSGNEDAETAWYPAAIPDVIAVGASDGSHQRVTVAVGGNWGSSWGTHLDLLAPGVSIYGLDAVDGLYAVARSGTSMSAPLVAGALGLLHAVDPTSSRQTREAVLLAGAADQVGTPASDLVGWDPEHGAGILDVGASVDLLLRYGTAPPGLRLHCDDVAPGEEMTCVVDDVPAAVFTRVRLAQEEAPGTCPTELAGLCWDVVGTGARQDVLSGADGSAQVTHVVHPGRSFGELGVAQAVVALGGDSEVSQVATLRLVGCGDGLVQPGEACDDADADDADGCASDCTADVAEGFVDVAGGGHHGCALREDGSLDCWGLDDQGQTDVPGGAWAELTAGRYHTCAVAVDGSVTCWGRSTEGQVAAPGGVFVALDAGWYHTCGVVDDGSLACWGRDDDGESSAPGGSFSAVSAGYAFSCALAVGGVPTCWGANDVGQLEAPGEALTALSSGGSHSCGLRAADATLTCWGWNDFGQATPPAGAWVDVASGHSHSCARDAAGAVTCWGRDFYDQLTVPEGTWVGVSAGRYHSCVWDEVGRRACWGANADGQAAPECGDGVVQSPETCDDGNLWDSDGCNGRCTGV